MGAFFPLNSYHAQDLIWKVVILLKQGDLLYLCICWNASSTLEHDKIKNIYRHTEARKKSESAAV